MFPMENADVSTARFRTVCFPFPNRLFPVAGSLFRWSAHSLFNVRKSGCGMSEKGTLG